MQQCSRLRFMMGPWMGQGRKRRQAAQKHPALTQDLADQQGDPYGDPGTATRICMHRW